MSQDKQMRRIKITLNAPVVLIFAFICLIALILNFITRGTSNHLVFSVYHSSLLDPLTYVRMFAHVFGHSGWGHFIANMSYILLLGPILEEKYGYKEIIEVIAITALITGLVHYIFFWNSSLCGASGVVFAFILLASFTSFREGEIPITFILVAAIYIGQQIVEGLFTSDNISQISHILGGIVGALSGYLLNRKS